MKVYHPIYGEMMIPDGKEEIENHLTITKSILAEDYHPVILAYQDILEGRLDLFRRGSHAV